MSETGEKLSLSSPSECWRGQKTYPKANYYDTKNHLCGGSTAQMSSVKKQLHSGNESTKALQQTPSILEELSSCLKPKCILKGTGTMVVGWDVLDSARPPPPVLGLVKVHTSSPWAMAWHGVAFLLPVTVNPNWKQLLSSWVLKHLITASARR